MTEKTTGEAGETPHAADSHGHPHISSPKMLLGIWGALVVLTYVTVAVTKFDLAGGPYNVVQSIRGKEGAFSGSVSYAVEIYDASNNRLLSAYVSKQYPNAMNVKASIGGLGAAKAGIRKGAEDLVARLN